MRNVCRVCRVVACRTRIVCELAVDDVDARNVDPGENTGGRDDGKSSVKSIGGGC